MSIKFLCILLIIASTISTGNKIPTLKTLAATICAKYIKERILPSMDSYERLQETYKLLQSNEFNWLYDIKEQCPDIYALVIKAYKKLCLSSPLIWWHTLQGHTQTVNSISYSNDGLLLASCSDDHTIKIWDLENGQCIQTLHGHTNWVNSIIYRKDDKQAASCSDNVIKIWDLERGSCIQTLYGHDCWITSIAYSEDGYRLVSCSYDNTIKIWDLIAGTDTFGTCIQTLQGHAHRVNSVMFSKDNKQIASGSSDNTIKIWDLASGQCVQTLYGHTHWVNAITYSQDGKQLISCSGDKTIRIWDLHVDASTFGTCIKTLYGHTQWINSIAKNNKQLASCSNDKTIKIWDLKTDQCIQTLHGHTNFMYCIAYRADGRQLVFGDNNVIKIWKQGYYDTHETVEAVLADYFCAYWFNQTNQNANTISMITHFYTSDLYKNLSENHKKALDEYRNRYPDIYYTVKSCLIV